MLRKKKKKKKDLRVVVTFSLDTYIRGPLMIWDFGTCVHLLVMQHSSSKGFTGLLWKKFEKKNYEINNWCGWVLKGIETFDEMYPLYFVWSFACLDLAAEHPPNRLPPFILISITPCILLNSNNNRMKLYSKAIF